MIQTKNAVIESAEIKIDGGCLSAYLYLKYENGNQSFGGWVLYLPESFNHHNLLSHAGHWIWRVMEIAEVNRWEQLEGKTVRVKAEHAKAHAIGHILRDDWFDPAVDFATGRDKMKQQGECNGK